MSHDSQKTVPLAWCGWRLPVPSDWRPLHIEGGWDRGHMMVGTDREAVLQIKWRRHANPGFSSAHWIARRCRQLGGTPDSHPPSPANFENPTFLRNLPSPGGGVRSIWYGFARPAGLLLEIVVNDAVTDATRDAVRHRLLPALDADPADAPTHWAVFNASFLAPAGFRLERWHLYSGDMALLLHNPPAGTRLAVRQVYPASTALARRPLERWLDAFPFRERRRYRAIQEPAPWTPSGTPLLAAGMRRRGAKRFAFPLTWISDRNSTAVGAVDGALDRLLLVEYDTPDPSANNVLETTVQNMNWANRQNGAPRAGLDARQPPAPPC